MRWTRDDYEPWSPRKRRIVLWLLSLIFGGVTMTWPKDEGR